MAFLAFSLSVPANGCSAIPVKVRKRVRSLHNLIETAKANGITPDKYYRYAFLRMAEADIV